MMCVTGMLLTLGSTAQILKKKTVAPAHATATVQPVKKTPVFLNIHSPVYQSSTLVRRDIIQKLFPFTKVYSYPDQTALHIRLVEHPGFAQAPAFKAAVTGQGGGCAEPGFNCSTNKVTVTATTTDFMNNNYSAQAAHIYPGAIYTFDHLYDGSFKEETGARNAVIVGTDNKNITGSTYETVANPNQFSVADAVAKIYQRFAVSGAANGSTSYQIYESSNSADLNIKIGAGGSGYGFSFNSLFNTDHQEQHEYLTIDVRKTLFTINVGHPDSGYFKTAPPAGSPLAVIGSVSYGVRILANLELTFKSQTDADALQASYSGYGVNANADLSLYSSNSSVNNTINAYIVGGASADAQISFDKSQLQQQIETILQNANYQNAQPISYELFGLDGSVIGGQSLTDQFVTCKCIPSGEQAPLVGGYAQISTDYNKGDNKDHDTHYSFGLFDQDNNPVASFHDDSDNDEYLEGSQNTVQMKIDNAAVMSRFSRGGHIHINIAPNGHDTWNIASFMLTLNFQNDPAGPEKITWQTINLSEGRRDVDLYFDGSFHTL